MQNNFDISLFFTDRQDGNLAFHVGDDALDVLYNHHRLAKKYNYQPHKLIHMRQIHSKNVRIVTQKESFFTPLEGDALITNLSNTPLMVMVADCSPVLLYDAKQGVIAAVHAGRAGAFKNILQEVIQTFKEHFGSDVKDIYAKVGPAIGVCCYEVGEEIVQQTKTLKLDYALQKRNNSHYLDIRSILRAQFTELGVLHVEFSSTCNCCENQKYFSYRKTPKTGRFAGVIIKREL